jgi:DNA-binding response OmpR family regulator
MSLHEEELDMSGPRDVPLPTDDHQSWSMRVLLVEDDDHLAESVTKSLVRFGHNPVRVSRGSNVPKRYRDVDLVLLDLLLPDCHGMSVLRVLRRVTILPVLVLTAVGDDRMVVRALQLGADDYLVKPFRETVLLARIDAVMRRSRIRAAPAPRIVVIDDVEIDLAARRVRVATTFDPISPVPPMTTIFMVHSLGLRPSRPGAAAHPAKTGEWTGL